MARNCVKSDARAVVNDWNYLSSLDIATLSSIKYKAIGCSGA